MDLPISWPRLYAYGLQRRLRLRIRDAGGIGFSTPPRQAFIKVSMLLKGRPDLDVVESVGLDPITYTPREGVVYFRNRRHDGSIPTDGTYTQFPNVRGLSVIR